MKKIGILLLIGFSLVIIISIVVKPSAVLYPELMGLICNEDKVCVDDITRMDEAQKLRDIALQNVEVKLGTLGYEPKLIFCASQECFESFGFKKAAAQTIHTFATVIGPRGWKSYYLEHELIHQWQYSHIGFKMYFAPEWLLEGMAYGLSNDLRKPLHKPFESYKKRFNAWYKSVDKNNISHAIKDEINRNEIY